MQEYCVKTSSNICFRYLLESPHLGDSNKYPKHMFYVEVRIKSVYTLFCPMRILYNSKFILIATSLGINDVVVTRMQCIFPLGGKIYRLNYATKCKENKHYTSWFIDYSVNKINNSCCRKHGTHTNCKYS